MSRDNDKVSPEYDAFVGIGRRWRWLYDLLVRGKVGGRFVVQSVSFRRGPALQSVVVKALDCETCGNVIAFGQGESFYQALSNVTNTIVKEGWRPDKYNKGLLS